MILLRPRLQFRTQKRRRGLSEPVRKVDRPERDANLQGRNALIDALAPEFDNLFQQFRGDADDEFRRQRIDGRGRLAIPINALEINDERFGGAMEEAMLQGIAVGGEIGIRHTGVEGIELDGDLVTQRARNWVRGPGAERIVQVTRGNKRQISRSIDAALRDNLSPTAAANRITREIGLTDQGAASLRNFEAGLIRQRIPSPEADTQLVRETIAQDVERRRDLLIRRRSRTILETEMQTAIQTGERQFYEEAAAEGQIDPDLMEKRWFTVLDGRVCAICEPLHGKVVGFNDSFSSGRFSGLHPPAHPNCRCFLEYKPDGEFGGLDDAGGQEALAGGPSRRSQLIEAAGAVLGFLETVERVPDGFRIPLTDRPQLPETVQISIAQPLLPERVRPFFRPLPREQERLEQAGQLLRFIESPRETIRETIREAVPSTEQLLRIAARRSFSKQRPRTSNDRRSRQRRRRFGSY